MFTSLEKVLERREHQLMGHAYIASRLTSAKNVQDENRESILSSKEAQRDLQVAPPPHNNTTTCGTSLALGTSHLLQRYSLGGGVDKSKCHISKGVDKLIF